MNRTEKIENLYIQALKVNPTKASLNNDYAVFLYKYKRDYSSALIYLNRAVELNPKNKTYLSNLQKVLQYQKPKKQRRYYVFSLIVVGIMLWINLCGYTNLMNLLSLFVLVQIVLNYQNNLSKLIYS